MAIADHDKKSVSYRVIEESDRGGVVACLCRSFPTRSSDYWFNALDRMAARPPIADCTKYGYLIEACGHIVGVLLTIFSRSSDNGVETIRCNLSSFCADDHYRGYAAKLAIRALRQKNVTFTNISPAVHTFRLMDALGFQRFCGGHFVFVPSLSRGGHGEVLEFDQASPSALALPDGERRLLSEHAAHGCQSLICVHDGEVVPFVLRGRRMLKGLVPIRQFVYCRSLADLARWAGPIGRYLLRSGVAICLSDANGPLPGLVGRYLPERGVKYYKGPIAPRPGDLAFSELMLFGP